MQKRREEHKILKKKHSLNWMGEAERRWDDSSVLIFRAEWQFDVATCSAIGLVHTCGAQMEICLSLWISTFCDASNILTKVFPQMHKVYAHLRQKKWKNSFPFWRKIEKSSSEHSNSVYQQHLSSVRLYCAVKVFCPCVCMRTRAYKSNDGRLCVCVVCVSASRIMFWQPTE